MLEVCSTRTWTKVRPNPPKSSEMEEWNFRPTAPSPFLVSSFFPSSRTRGGSDWVLGPFLDSCFSYCVCIFLSARVWSVALLAALPEKPSWNSFLALWSDVICMFIEHHWVLKAMQILAVDKISYAFGTCWIWNQPFWSFASQLLHGWGRHMKMRKAIDKYLKLSLVSFVGIPHTYIWILSSRFLWN